MLHLVTDFHDLIAVDPTSEERRQERNQRLRLARGSGAHLES